MTSNRKASPRIADLSQSPSDRISAAETLVTMLPSQLFPACQMQGGERLVRLPELLALVGISRATAYRYMASGKLPAPIRLSTRCIAWKASIINIWFAHLIAA